MSEVRVTCRKNPARPEDKSGIIEVYVDGHNVPLPHVGQDKVIMVAGTKWAFRTEPTVKNEQL